MSTNYRKKTTKIKLYPAYSYGRIYKSDILKKDIKTIWLWRISTTMNLGGDEVSDLFRTIKERK